VVLLVLLALTSGVAIVLSLMVVGLLEAPWPILLSLLFLGFFGLQRLTAHATDLTASLPTTKTQASSEPEQPTPPEIQASESQADGQTFTYRGVKYRSPSSAQPATDEPPSITEGVYRGQRWQRTNHSDATQQLPPSSDQPSELKYRGHRVK
jgi:hypothetical protein